MRVSFVARRRRRRVLNAEQAAPAYQQGSLCARAASGGSLQGRGAMDRETRARHVLKLCEFAARNAVPDLDDVDDPSMQDMAESYDALVTKIRYLMRQAEAAWTPAFGEVLKTSSCMLVTKMTSSRKERKRGFSGRCMACGRQESNCRYAINLAGDLDSDAWLRGPLEVLKQYNHFCDEYEPVFARDFVDKCVGSKELPQIDKGCYIVGETCLRKAKLRYSLQTLLLDACYDAERMLETMSGTLEQDVVYTADEEACIDFVKSQDALELAIADPRRKVPDLRVDNSFWSILDEVGLTIAGNDDRAADRLAMNRAKQLLASGHPDGSEENECSESEGSDSDVLVCDDGSESGEDSDVCDKQDQVKRRSLSKGKRRRACSESDEDEDAEQQPPCQPPATRSSSAAGTRVTRSASRAAAPSAAASSSSAKPAAPTSRAKRPARRTTPTAASLAANARSTMPSRKKAIIALMELSQKLLVDGRDSDSAVCTHAIMTLQELAEECGKNL